MSDEKDRMKQDLVVDGQSLTLDISTLPQATYVAYEFSSKDPIHPMRIAAALLCVVEAICVDNGTTTRNLLAIPERELDTKLH